MSEDINKEKIKKIINKFKKYFDEETYLEQYDYDIWITITIIIFTTLLVIYLYIINNIKSLKANWEINKCNPLYIPFAAFINSQDIKFTIDNMNSCLNDLNKKITNEVDTPIQNLLNQTYDSFASRSNIISNITDFFTYLYNSSAELFKQFIQKMLSILTEIDYISNDIISFLSKILAIITIIYDTIILLANFIRLSFYIMALSFFTIVVIPSILGFVLAIIVTIVLAVLCSLPFIGFVFFPIYVSYILIVFLLLIFMIFVIIMYVVFSNFASNIIKDTTSQLPKNINN